MPRLVFVSFLPYWNACCRSAGADRLRQTKRALSRRLSRQQRAERLLREDVLSATTPFPLNDSSGAVLEGVMLDLDHFISHLCPRHRRGSGCDAEHRLRLRHVVCEEPKRSDRHEILHILGHLMKENHESDHSLHGIEARLIQLLQELLPFHQPCDAVGRMFFQHPRAIEWLREGLDGLQLENFLQELPLCRALGGAVALCDGTKFISGFAVCLHPIESCPNAA
mmetsp:Transcript_41862/g.101745  ORF Transcript_41862/g.101745 Transcript_41862/m.101745 type:complete len:224 (-) Transcript_41862:592-1263(-)